MGRRQREGSIKGVHDCYVLVMHSTPRQDDFEIYNCCEDIEIFFNNSILSSHRGLAKVFKEYVHIEETLKGLDDGKNRAVIHTRQVLDFGWRKYLTNRKVYSIQNSYTMLFVNHCVYAMQRGRVQCHRHARVLQAYPNRPWAAPKDPHQGCCELQDSATPRCRDYSEVDPRWRRICWKIGPRNGCKLQAGNLIIFHV